MRQGDVITSINGVAVKNISAVQEQIARYRPDDQIEVVIIRDGKERHFNVLLEKIDY
jgi:S1-C subfamily serine protease